MAEARAPRRLAAILAADVAGYSRLMAADEAGTLAALREVWTGHFNPAVATCRGRIVKMMGDGALVEFASAVDAVECAVVIQRAIASYNSGREDREPIELRIGVNVGDIVVDGDDSRPKFHARVHSLPRCALWLVGRQRNSPCKSPNLR